MKNHISSVLSVGFMLLLMQDAFAQQALPISRQATMVENTSSADVMIEATGIYNSSETRDRRIDRDLNDNGVIEATKDAKKAAVWFILNGSTDPMLNTPDAQRDFRPHESYFYDLNNINQWITWEQSGLVDRARTSDGAGLQVIKRFRLNTDMIRSELERFHVIRSGVELSDATDLPSIIVRPHAPEGNDPFDLLRDDPHSTYAIMAANYFLDPREDFGTRKYDVISTRRAPLSDSDIHIIFSGTLEDAGFGTQRMAVQLRVHVTPTVRLIGTETGYSEGRSGDQFESNDAINEDITEAMIQAIREAMNDAIDKVLPLIDDYWINAGR